MGLCSESFGPYFWGALHLACLANVDLESLKTFINSYQMVLPCYWCRIHFSEVIAENPIPDIDIFKWSIDVHNIVNKKLGKPVMTYEDALEHWLSGCEPEEIEESEEPLFDKSTTILSVLFITIIITLILKNFRK